MEVVMFFGFVITLGLLFVAFGLPIINFMRMNQIRMLEERLLLLEKAFGRLRRELHEGTFPLGESVSQDLPDEEPAPIEPDFLEEPTTEPILIETQPILESERRYALRSSRVRGWYEEAGDWEAWLGQKGLGWAAVLLVLIGVSFFLKYAFDNDWIGPQGQVCLGLGLGLGLCVGGYRRHRSGMWLFGQMLSSAGVILLYLCTFATFGFFELLSPGVGSLFLVALVALTLLLSVSYEAPVMAWMAVVGGLLTPLLIPSDYDQYISLFSYLLVINLGIVCLVQLRAWGGLTTLAYVGTQGLFLLWVGRYYHPEKMWWVLGFQVALYLVYIGKTVVSQFWQQQRTGPEVVVQQVLLACFLAGSGYGLLRVDYEPWMGTLATVMAIVYTLLTYFAMIRMPKWGVLSFVYLAIGVTFLATVFPLQTSSVWVCVGWSVLGLALWWFGLRIDAQALRVLGLVFLGLGVLRLWFVDTRWTGRELVWPILNGYAVPALVVAGCLLVGAELSRRMLKAPPILRRGIQAVLGLGGVVLVWFLLTFEIHHFFDSRWTADHFIARTAVSIMWALYATGVLAVGLRLASEPLRWTALGFFGMALLKVVFVDTSQLAGLYRVVVFLGLAMMMAIGAWGYQKLFTVGAVGGGRE
ncbi:MAG: DUF2339 domain-containing protein [Gemmataceae bacterium]